jgi:hypothetical protein
MSHVNKWYSLSVRHQRKTQRKTSLRAISSLRSVVLDVTFKGRSAEVMGFLFAKTKTRVILLNHLRNGAQLGRLQNIRRHHVEPEAEILVFPLDAVKKIRFLE